MKKAKKFYEKLKIQLDETTVFPTDYLYKFIVSSEGDKVADIQQIFDNKGAVIKTKKSETGKYSSISVVVKVGSSEEVINYYREAGKIEGIISL